MLAPYKSYWAAMNKFFIYACPCVNKDFNLDDVFSCFSSHFLSTQKSTSRMRNFLDIFGIYFHSSQSNQQQKRWRCFANNRAWMIRWNVCRKDLHFSGKRPQIGLCRKISNLYKVSSVFNVCFISYKTS